MAKIPQSLGPQGDFHAPSLAEIDEAFQTLKAFLIEDYIEEQMPRILREAQSEHEREQPQDLVSGSDAREVPTVQSSTLPGHQWIPISFAGEPERRLLDEATVFAEEGLQRIRDKYEPLCDDHQLETLEAMISDCHKFHFRFERLIESEAVSRMRELTDDWTENAAHNFRYNFVNAFAPAVDYHSDMMEYLIVAMQAEAIIQVSTRTMILAVPEALAAAIGRSGHVSGETLNDISFKTGIGSLMTFKAPPISLLLSMASSTTAVMAKLADAGETELDVQVSDVASPDVEATIAAAEEAIDRIADARDRAREQAARDLLEDDFRGEILATDPQGPPPNHLAPGSALLL